MLTLRVLSAELPPIQEAERYKRIKYTLPVFIEEARKIHGLDYNYDKVVKEHINQGVESIVPIICKQCGNEWETSIRCHISAKSKCPKCAKKNRWTLESFTHRAQEIHGNKFNYVMITKQHINGKDSKVPIKCKSCNHIWECSIANHINNKRGCPKCNNRLRWTYDRFILEARAIHDDNYTYHLTPTEHITVTTHIKTTCHRCLYVWLPTVKNHIQEKSGCPQCGGVAHWNYDRFIMKANDLHGDKYDYSMVPHDITGAHSLLTVICKTCDYRWQVSIDGHINAKSGCPNCVNLARWTYNELMSTVGEIHGNKYNYTEILPEHITSNTAKFPVTCNKCQYKWFTNISHHITRRQGCPTCNVSRGESACAQYFNNKQIPYDAQWVIRSLPNRRYDFMFVYEGIKYILEFDGRQHFEYVEFIHRSTEEFLAKQSIDVLKTQSAINEGYHVIRIDHTQLDNIPFHIDRALSLRSILYFSTEHMYSYISAKVTTPKKLSLLIQR